MKVLITGGAGFIGSHLADSLIKRKDKVICLDDLSTGSLLNVYHLLSHRGFQLVIDTIFNRKVLEELVKKSDVVVHLAAAVGVKYVIEHPLTSLLTNTKGTEAVLEFSNKYRKKIIFSSTSEVYGKNKRTPMKETDDRVLGATEISRWGYAESKSLDEFLAFAYAKEKRLQVIVIRFFNIAGPRQSPEYGMVIPRFVKQALANRPLTVYGSGRQTRTFAHVADAVKGVIGLMEKKDAVGKLFNIGGTGEISIKDLAARIIRLSKSRSSIKYIPYNRAYGEDFEDMPRRVPDISRIRRLTGFTPAKSLDDIIISVIRYFKK